MIKILAFTLTFSLAWEGLAQPPSPDSPAFQRELLKTLQAPSSPIAKRLLALQLFSKIAKNGETTLEWKKPVDDFIFEVLCGKYSTEHKKKVFSIAERLKLEPYPALMEKYEKAASSTDISPESWKYAFKILYLHLRYTESFKKRMLAALSRLSNEALSHNADLLAEQIYSLYNIGAYNIPDKTVAKRLIQLSWGRREMALERIAPPPQMSLSGYHYALILSKEPSLLVKFLQLYPETFIYIINSCVSALYYDLSDTRYKDGLPIFDALALALERNSSDDKITATILKAFSENFFTLCYLKKHLPLFHKISKDKKIYEANKDSIDAILDFISLGERKNIEEFIKDNSAVERKIFEKLARNDSNRLYNILRCYAICYDDFSLPDNYQATLNEILQGNNSDELQSLLSIFLIQNNHKYDKTIKKFIMDFLNNFDRFSKEMRLVFLGDGISYHWINDPEIREKCLAILTRSSKTENIVPLVTVFWNVDADQKKVVDAIYDRYETFASAHAGTEEDIEDIKKALLKTMKAMYARKHGFFDRQDHGADLDAWKKAVDSMPEDGEKE